eukprot:SAG11_NODE_13369_length_658_cov_0.987478_1_plen_93_part_00
MCQCASASVVAMLHLLPILHLLPMLRLLLRLLLLRLLLLRLLLHMLLWQEMAKRIVLPIHATAAAAVMLRRRLRCRRLRPRCRYAAGKFDPS